MGVGCVLRSPGRDAGPPLALLGLGARGSLKGPCGWRPRPASAPGSSPARPAAPLRSRLGRSPGVSKSAAVCRPSPSPSPLLSYPPHPACPYAG